MKTENVIYDGDTGRVSLTIQSSDPEMAARLAQLNTPDGHAVIEVSTSSGVQGEHYVEGGELVQIPQQPSVWHVFDYALKMWVDSRTLQDLKDAKWAEIRAARDAAEFSTFMWDGSLFDSDAVSQSRVQGAAQMATLANLGAQPFSITWTLADNTTRVLNGQEMIDVGIAMGTHIRTQHDIARTRRQQIQSALTPEDVGMIAW